jgi:hypothetical protein
MNLPLPLTILASAGSPEDPVYEIYLNRVGINSIEVPREEVRGRIGHTLHLRFLNRGAPIHITITSANASMYTDFFHENMYILDEMVLDIPLRGDCSEGFFDLEIISGYGVMKTTLRVNVKRALHRSVQIHEVELPLQPEAHGRPHLMMIMMGIALVLYSGWIYTRIDALNIVSFVLLVIGALYTWYRQV